MSLEITKISIKGADVNISYGQDIEVGESLYDGDVADKRNAPPLESFTNKMKELAGHLLKILPLDVEATKGLTVDTVAIDRLPEGYCIQPHCEVTAKNMLSGAFTVKPKISERDEAWDNKLTDIVIELIDEAEQYLGGNYAQTELDFEETKRTEAVGVPAGEVDELEEHGMRIVA